MALIPPITAPFDTSRTYGILNMLINEINAISSSMGSGSVNGPGTSISGNFALWNNTTGTLLKDGGTPGLLAFVSNLSGPITSSGGTTALDTSPNAIPNGWTATTQSAADNSTKLATTAYVDGAISTGSAFSKITSGTNAIAAMVVGTGASISSSGSGTITATSAPLSGITGAGTGILTALSINTGSAGAPILFNGNAGTPSALVGTNITGTASGLTAGAITIPAALGSSTATTQTPGDNSTKLATTAYVAAALLGQDFKEACKYATTAALPAIIYANGSSGVGATLTGVSLGALSVDGNSPNVGDRILVKNQVTTFQNGIYTVTATGSGAAVFVLTRSTDFNQSSEIDTGDSTFISAGNTLSATTWAYNGADAPVIGTGPITFVQTAGQGSFTAGNGISITGMSIAIDTAVTVDKTTVQTLSNKTFVSPALGTPVSGVATNLTGTASGLTAGNVSTNANLTGPITSAGNTTSLNSSAQAIPSTWTATTQTAGDSTTAIATDAFVQAAVSAKTGVIFNQWFGDGSDGNVTVTTSITLARDMYYNNLTISGSGAIANGAFRFFIAGILDISAAGANALNANGLAGNSSSGTTAPTAQSTQGSNTVGSYANNVGATGVAGGTTTGANSGGSTGAATSRGGNQSSAATGGAGGAGSSGTGGSGVGTRVTIAFSVVNRNLSTQVFGTSTNGTLAQITGGQSGRANGSGGGDGTAGGGAGNGGNAGGVLAIFAKTINRGASTSASALSARGGTGGNGGTPAGGNRGGGGGGDGAGGGYILLVCNNLTGVSATNALDASGGVGGIGGNGTGTGTGGQGGASGGGGQIDVYNLSSNTYTNIPISSATSGGLASGNTGGSGGVPATSSIASL